MFDVGTILNLRAWESGQLRCWADGGLEATVRSSSLTKTTPWKCMWHVRLRCQVFATQAIQSFRSVDFDQHLDWFSYSMSVSCLEAQFGSFLELQRVRWTTLMLNCFWRQRKVLSKWRSGRELIGWITWWVLVLSWSRGLINANWLVAG